MKRTLIIGNGFDLDAGLQTSYRSFAASTYWPFKDAKKYNNNFNTLAYELNQATRLNTWFDVEELLYLYAKKEPGEMSLAGGQIELLDKISFDRLHSSLMNYLREEEMNFEVNEDSIAAVVLLSFLQESEENNIYSFNYTDLNHIADRLGIFSHVECDYLHGSVASGHIILGVGDMRDLKDEYFYMHKTSSHYFASHNIIPDILASDEIVIFGHSLGYNDYPYFSPFFNHQSRISRGELPQRKKIAIITYDRNSELEIKRHLHDLTSRDDTLLWALNDMKIFCTSDKTQKREIYNYLMI